MVRRRSLPSRPALTADEREQVLRAGREAGLAAVGSCSARPWTGPRAVLERRRDAGMAAGMAFTYKNPARSTDPSRILRSAASIVVGVHGYSQTVVAPDGVDRPTARIARYATADHYGRLAAGLEAMAGELRSLGHRAVVMADDNSLVDREAAWRAGVGWYGKNSLLLLPGRGSWFVLGSVITDAVITHIPSPVPDGCGTCTRCLDGCPTGAIVAPGVVDARRCLAWLLQAPGEFPPAYRAALGDRIYGCDDCQEVCPPNRTVELRSRRGDPWPVEADPGPTIDALELLALDDAALLERCSRWYLPDRDPAVVRRNLLIVLGNSGRGDHAGVIAAVSAYALGPDPLLAEHARWALDRLGISSVSAAAPVSGDAGVDRR